MPSVFGQKLGDISATSVAKPSFLEAPIGRIIDCISIETTTSAYVTLVQDLIDQGLVNLGQPSVTKNPLLAHTTHSVPPPTGGIHHMHFVQDDVMHMLSWDDGLPKMIVPNDGYEIVGVTSNFSIPIPFNLVLDITTLQLIPSTPSNVGHEDTFTSFILWPKDIDVHVMTRSGRIAQATPPITRTFDGTDSRKEIHVEISTTPKGLIHMMTADRTTCIVFSIDDLPPASFGHTRHLHITVVCLGHRVSYVILDNGSALKVYSLSTAIALSYAPLDFGLSTRTVKVYDSTKREVMGTLEIELLIEQRQHGSSEFVTTVDRDTPFSLGFVPTKDELSRLFHEGTRRRCMVDGSR
ncbi:hypothetical protein CK203_061234 [Vitis vinifera]|uniref:Uncharacterized protein n=2 Tax=Vitis vinifera TaxID=29760 RepID=A0A438GK01_VITVI|nr:hypothetical protein CK203_061234 [Vitis vinifera]